jgi:hypothetical protein
MPSTLGVSKHQPGIGRARAWMRRCAIGLLISVAAIALAYLLVGHTVIDVLYEGSTGTRLDDTIARQDLHPLEHYYDLADRRVLKASVTLGLLAWGLLGVSCASSRRVLVLFLATDALFILLACLHGATTGLLYGSTDGFLGTNWALGIEWGYAETFQYAKEFGIVVVSLMLFLRQPRMLSLGWLALFLYILLDDALQIHERVGQSVAQALETSWVLADHVTSAFFGLLILVLLGLGYHSAPSWLRRASWPLWGLVATLVLFGVVVDTINQVADTSVPVLFWLGHVVEEAGEMVTISLIAWYVHRLATAWRGSEGRVAEHRAGSLELTGRL